MRTFSSAGGLASLHPPISRRSFLSQSSQIPSQARLVAGQSRLPATLPGPVRRWMIQQGRRRSTQAAITVPELQFPEAAQDSQGVTYPDQSSEDLVLSCTTFNVLAPIYKRLGGREDVRESQFPDQWRQRNERIVEELLLKVSSIVCLQELWLSNPELVELYDEALASKGYEILKLPRPNNRGDGLLTAVKTDKLEVVRHEDLHFNDCGDRVAQLLWLRSRPGTCTPRGSGTNAPSAACSPGPAGMDAAIGMDPCMEMLVVNTHLLFPHNKESSFIRLRQVYKVLEHVAEFTARHGLETVPVVLCGDLNGTKRGQVYNFLRSQGFVSSYDMATNQPDSDQRWVSHKNHHGVVCGVDFIWLLNPKERRSALGLDWKAAVFSYLTKKLEDMGCTSEQEAFDFLCGHCPLCTCNSSSNTESREGSGSTAPAHVITVESIEHAATTLGDMALARNEVEEMIAAADRDGNGVVDFEEFLSVLHRSDSAANLPVPDCSAPHALEMPPPGACISGDEDKICDGPCLENAAGTWKRSRGAPALDIALGGAAAAGGGAESGPIAIAMASLYPPEAEQGVWPASYTLSDHAVLTAVFTLANLGLAASQGFDGIL